ncbi:hypothetical protein ACFVZM_34050 [Streptomyces sioyaensis]|uniref:hypothetical protein n=1 Tax=Streptomyces sioyaensis TaxID=67364 RepID=UPI0036AB459C
MPYFPSHKTGLIPARMRLDETDEFGNGIARFTFFFYDDGALEASYDFTSLNVSEVSTSGIDQRLDSAIVVTPSSTDSIPLVEKDAGLQTLSDAPPTSALQTQTVSLSLGGDLAGKWTITFEVPIHEFNLDGWWVKL